MIRFLTAFAACAILDALVTRTAPAAWIAAYLHQLAFLAVFMWVPVVFSVVCLFSAHKRPAGLATLASLVALPVAFRWAGAIGVPAVGVQSLLALPVVVMLVAAGRVAWTRRAARANLEQESATVRDT